MSHQTGLIGGDGHLFRLVKGNAEPGGDRLDHEPPHDPAAG